MSSGPLKVVRTLTWKLFRVGRPIASLVGAGARVAVTAAVGGAAGGLASLCREERASVSNNVESEKQNGKAESS